MPIDFSQHLNSAQLEAATAMDGPILVIAGAGSGKTRTIVYRLAYMVEQSVPPESILLMTFTRKASQEMLHRAGLLLGQDPHAGPGLHGVQGGTFHSFAFQVLRREPPPGYPSGFTIMDRSDAEGIIRDVKTSLGLGKGDRSYPKARTVLELISKSRNKEMELHDILQNEAMHLLPYEDDFSQLMDAFTARKKEHGLMDYDDLLFGLEELFLARPEVLAYYGDRFRYLMVDEYQDTNLIQARLVKLLALSHGNVMAVGDDAQSIYAFRGANVRNILDFPKIFENTRIIKLEQNYRSTQPILDLTNRILAGSNAGYAKDLFSERHDGSLPHLIKPLSDRSQAKHVTDKILELLKRYDPEDIAVLFRAGYQSFQVETSLNRLGIRYAKFGGIKFTEAAHVKDVLALLRLVANPSDLPAWIRATAHMPGVGPKTAVKIFDALIDGNQQAIAKHCAKRPELPPLIKVLDTLRGASSSPAALLETGIDYYQPILETSYPDDHPRRRKELDELVSIAETFTDLDMFLANVSLDPPDSDTRGDAAKGAVTLSTVHSAKGLEWSAVLIIDLVEDRFPSRHALARDEDYEEERRLLYVACTRAKDSLSLFSPLAMYMRGRESSEPTRPSPFLGDLNDSLYEEYMENYGGYLSRRATGHATPFSGRGPVAPPRSREEDTPEPSGNSKKTTKLGHCTHKIFGRGKIVEILSQDKYRVHFPGFGLKVILADYLSLEE